MKKRRMLISVVVLMVLLFNLSIGVLAGEDDGTARPKVINPIVSSSPGDDGTTRPK